MCGIELVMTGQNSQRPGGHGRRRVDRADRREIIAENQDIYKKYGLNLDWRTLDQYFARLEGAEIDGGPAPAARILGYYVREEKVLRLEEAIRKMTSFAAEAAGLSDRGLIKPGFAADLAVFDPAAVRSVATFESPNRYSQGFRYVAVNGVLVVDDGKITGKTPGRALRGPGYEPGPKSKVQSPK